jgi:DNA-binding CsgD family transcriptional regulator
MPSVLRDQDLRGLLDVLDAGRNCSATDCLPDQLLERLHLLIPCDSVSFLELDIGRQDCLRERTFPTEDVPEQLIGDDVFWRHYDSDLHCSYPSRTGDDRSVTTVSDFYTLPEYHSSPMYCEYTRYFGAEHEALLCLAARPGMSTRLLFARGSGPDFDDRDRLLLALLRPHLNELDQEIQRRRQPVPDLTARQWELLRLTARGRTNTEIASTLFISTNTVRKHLENIYARLGVTTRMAAVAKALPHDWVTTDDPHRDRYVV